MLRRQRFLGSILLTCAGAATLSAAALAGDRPLTSADLMQFRKIEDAVISRDGRWIAYTLHPDRGDGEVVARATSGATEYHIERGSEPQISGDGRWVAAVIVPPLEERLAAEERKSEEGEDEPKKGLALLDLRDGSEERIEGVESFVFADDGRYLAYKLYREEDEQAESEEESDEKEKDQDKEELAARLILRDLTVGTQAELTFVTEFAFDGPSTVLAYAVSAPSEDDTDHPGDGVYLRRLGQGSLPEETLVQATRSRFAHLTWAEMRSRLAFVAAPLDDEGEPTDAVLWLWDADGPRAVASRTDAPEGWTIPAANELAWSRDGEPLFFGFKPVEPEGEETPTDAGAPFEPYDLDAILAKRDVDVWHWNDPLIVPNQKEQWEDEKDRTYRAVHHVKAQRTVALADRKVRIVETANNPEVALAQADVHYLKELTWDGPYADLYTVDLHTGDHRQIASRLADPLEGAATLSPGGRYVLYYDAGNWHLHDLAADASRNVTAELGVPFADEDHDYPRAPPGYGFGEWLRDDSAILVYDKYDVWQIPTDGSRPLCLTAGNGREREVTFRQVDLDPEEPALEPGMAVLLSAYHQKRKDDAFYSARLGESGVAPLLETGQHRLHFVARAEDAPRWLYTRERYDEFPDLWTTLPDLERARFGKPQRLSDANPQMAEFAWGQAELVEWASLDGIPLQGVLIKPGNYVAGRRYPLLVYFYRFFSQRLHQFNEPVINHRPSFPIYASNGYAIFLPDIRFEVGRSGFSATKCLVPRIQKLVDSGVADPQAIGLHGHSWSGYQTAFVVTQTDIFKAAVAGAPVANMTSAYSGIRWGSGLARQFQYEKSQSRIGASLWEASRLYIENSPVFYADRIRTPLLIQFGDQDEAVPWYQGIELYLACRRLQKECIFLQYRDEPHHLQKYPNKLDYSIKMKEFFDHHLKGEPAPEWMSDGVPYRGE